MSKYNTYKASGIEWLGDIPEHWEVKRIKDYVDVNIKSLGSDTDSELEIKYLDISNVNNTGITGEIHDLKFYESPSRARRIVQNGDVIMSTVRPYLMAIAYLENIPKNMIASTGFAVMTSKPLFSSKYLFYKIVCHWFNETVNSKSVGASYPALNNDVLVATKILSPPLTEQTAIAHYLDEKTSKLDVLIKNKKAQIAQLKEVRQIEINTAVTKGLDKNVKLKASGVEWLGDVPEHWEVKRLKDIVSLKSGESITSSDISVSGLYPVYGGNGLRGYSSFYTHSGLKAIIGRQGALCGNINYTISGNYWASEHALVVDILYGSNVIWVGELLRCMNLNNYSVSAAQPGLSVDNIIVLKVVVPPQDEQTVIAQYLDEKTSKIDRLVSNLESQIDQLQELRKIEIFNAVTGKIKVV